MLTKTAFIWSKIYSFYSKAEFSAAIILSPVSNDPFYIFILSLLSFLINLIFLAE